MKKLAIIGSGDMAAIIAQNAKKMGICTYSFSNNSKDKVVGISDKHFHVDIFDIKKIENICRKQQVDGIIATTELTISITAKLAKLLNLNGMPIDIAENITDKSYVRKVVNKLHAIQQPEYYLYEKGDALPVIKAYPVIIKPTSLGGKRGITVVYNSNQLEAAIDYAYQYITKPKSKIIIEEFIGEGKEYSVECLSFHNIHRVIQITEKISSGPPHCVELGHMQPARLSIELKKKVEEAIVQLLEFVGLDNTASCIEIKIIKERIYLIEINSRMGGDTIASHLTEFSTGYPYIKGCIDIALNQFVMPDLDVHFKKYCGILFVTKQTYFLKHLFEKCTKYTWLYKKNLVSSDLKELVNNQSSETNYMMYVSDNGIPEEIKKYIK